jgi:copper(I)-binding protein
MTGEFEVGMKAGLLSRWVTIGLVLGAVMIGAQVVRSACAAAAGGIQVSGAYALPDGKSPHQGYVYLTITASRSTKDALTGGSTPAAASMTLLVPARGAKAPKPGEQPSLEIDDHLPVVLQPGGPRFVLKGLRHPLHPGQKITIVLTFLRADPIDVTVDVLAKAPAAGAPRLPKGVKID